MRWPSFTQISQWMLLASLLCARPALGSHDELLVILNGRGICSATELLSRQYSSAIVS